MIRGHGDGFYSASHAPAWGRPGTRCACLRPMKADRCESPETGCGFTRPTFPPQRTRDGSPSSLRPRPETAPQQRACAPRIARDPAAGAVRRNLETSLAAGNPESVQMLEARPAFFMSAAQELLSKRNSKERQKKDDLLQPPGPALCGTDILAAECCEWAAPRLMRREAQACHNGARCRTRELRPTGQNNE